MKILSAYDWKAFYREERQALGESGLCKLVREAPQLELAGRGALIFPHTRLASSGWMPAAVAKAVVASGRDTVLALGVLHGGRRRDVERVRAARAGERAAIAELRGVHGEGAPFDGGCAAEEFSLDNFAELLRIAAAEYGVAMPALIRRFPFLAGDAPGTLPGFDELTHIADDGAAIVATGDLIHHGVGYDTPEIELLPMDDDRTIATAHATILQGMEYLGERRYSEFREHALRVRSDFRDVGPVLRELLNGDFSVDLLDLTLVRYADVLESADPTWVAAALLKVQ